MPDPALNALVFLPRNIFVKRPQAKKFSVALLQVAKAKRNAASVADLKKVACEGPIGKQG
jgi:hypothetical protein